MASSSTDPSAADDDEYQAQYDDDEEEDDERTIEEEEQLGSDDEQNELDNLQADADMPIDELLKLYGPNASANHQMLLTCGGDEENSSSEDENENVHRHQYHHLFHVGHHLLANNEDDSDGSDDSYELDFVKQINVGDEYQAQVAPQAEYSSVDDGSDDKQMPNDEYLWSPSALSDEQIDDYLKKIRSEFPYADDEISLQTLFNCGMNVELALENFRQLPVKTIYSYLEWTSEDIQRLEEGLREYQKDFFQIYLHKCSNRTVRDIIHGYYEWKKSERYHSFIEEQQCMNVIRSVTDIIERLLEEKEHQLCTAAGVVDSTNSPFNHSSDLKRNSAVSCVTLHSSDLTTAAKRTFDQIDDEIEPPSKKQSVAANISPPTTAVV